MMNPIDLRLDATLLAIHFVNYSPATSMVMPMSANTWDFSCQGASSLYNKPQRVQKEELK